MVIANFNFKTFKKKRIRSQSIKILEKLFWVSIWLSLGEMHIIHNTNNKVKLIESKNLLFKFNENL